MNDREGVNRLDERVGEFLGKHRIAIWGAEETKGGRGQAVAGKFRKRGVNVIAVNPRFVHDPSLERTSSLTRIDPPVEAVLVFVDRGQAMAAVDDCLEAKIPLVWPHDALSQARPPKQPWTD